MSNDEARLILKKPSLEGLAEYADALQRGWSPDNVRPEVRLESQRVILANGGVLVERFSKRSAYGNLEGLRFRIVLAS